MKFLSILIKPVSGACNIDCRYCFYKELVEGHQCERCMSEAVMKQLIDEAFASGAEEILFAFQGGEPMLAGEHYYETFIDYVNLKKGNAKVSYSIQTNGILLTDKYIEIFKKHDFLVGLSLDGPKFIHDQYRMTYEKKGTFDKVISNGQKLLRAGVQVNILTVITKYASSRAEKLYKFYKKSGFYFIQFIPCMDSIMDVQGAHGDSLSAEDYYLFLKNLFDEWYADFMMGEYISIRHFDNWVRMIMRQPVDTCSLSGNCGSYFVIEQNGDVYPCDFYVGEAYKLGNITEMTFECLLQKLIASGFLDEYKEQISDDCVPCKNRGLCHGGCKRDWVYEGNQGKTRYCKALDRFFTEYKPKLYQVAQIVSRL